MEKASLNFEWSLQPILTWMRLIGVPLHRNQENGLELYLKTGFSAILFFFNMTISLVFFIGAIVFMTSSHDSAASFRQEFSLTATWLWNSIIGRFNHSIANLGSHFALLAFTAIKWPSLMTNFQKIVNEEKSKFFSNEDYKRIRLLSWSGLFLIFTGLIGIVSYNAFKVWSRDDYTSTSKAVESIFSFCQIYANSSITLFSCLAWTLGNFIQGLSNRVKCCYYYSPMKKSNKTSASNEDNNTVLLNLLDQWKSQYLSIRCLIEELNDTFNLTLLIVTSTTFVRLINNAFVLLTPMVRGSNWIDAMFVYLSMTQDIFILVMISYVSHRLENKAISLARELRSLSFKNHNLQIRANCLVMQVLQNLPKITAMGFFQINLHLIPSIVGTTLTYLIILCQFQTSEKN